MLQYEEAYNTRVTIIRFRDGDTVEVHAECTCCRGLRYETIRLPGIDSWELLSGSAARAKRTAEELTFAYYGRTGWATSLSVRRDKYGRRLTDLLIGGELLSHALVASGHAWYGVGTPEPAYIVGTTIHD